MHEPLGSLHPYIDPTRHLGPLRAIQGRLDGCERVGQLLAVASLEAAPACGFARGLVLPVVDDRLDASEIDPIPDPASDALRRRCSDHPIELEPGSADAELVRLPEASPGPGPSVIREALELEEHLLAAIVPESDAIAIVVVDRSEPAVTNDDALAVALYAHLVAQAVLRVVLRLRIQELADEMRHLTTSAQALMREVQEAPANLTGDLGLGPIFTTTGPAMASGSELNELLNVRERAIMLLVARGHSNREIGEQLHLAPDTIKVSVGRILRKLGASNRAAAVARYMELRLAASER